MEFNRFVQYAKYDLTINKAFYRNTSIVTASIITGMAIMGFLIRWSMIRNLNVGVDSDETIDSWYYSINATVKVIFGVVGILMMVFAGCFNHPLRNKQGRISTLILPATNGEKFLWHTLLVIIGGFLLCVVSVVAADVVNALLSLIAGFPTDKIHSITNHFFRCFVWDFSGEGMEGWSNISPFRRTYHNAFVGFVLASSIWSFTAFVFGNSVKYRYNIIWTILALWVLNFIVTILGTIVFSMFVFNLENHDFNPSYYENSGWALYWIGMAIIVGTAALMWWKSWRNYKNAQITNKWNRI